MEIHYPRPIINILRNVVGYVGDALKAEELAQPSRMRLTASVKAWHTHWTDHIDINEGLASPVVRWRTFPPLATPSAIEPSIAIRAHR